MAWRVIIVGGRYRREVMKGSRKTERYLQELRLKDNNIVDGFGG